MGRREVRIFLDSNVVLSGLFSDRGSPRIILDLLTLDLPVLAGVTGEFNIVEIERNLQKKMPQVLPIYREYLPLLHLEITPPPWSPPTPGFGLTLTWRRSGRESRGTER